MLLRYIYLKMRHFKIVLVLAIAANVWECGDTKFGGEKGEIIPRRRRCYDGSLPKRLKKRDRKLSLDSGSEVCHRFYPRVSCCPNRRAAFQILHRRDARVCWLQWWLVSMSFALICCYLKHPTMFALQVQCHVAGEYMFTNRHECILGLANIVRISLTWPQAFLTPQYSLVVTLESCTTDYDTCKIKTR